MPLDSGFNVFVWTAASLELTGQQPIVLLCGDTYAYFESLKLDQPLLSLRQTTKSVDVKGEDMIRVERLE